MKALTRLVVALVVSISAVACGDGRSPLAPTTVTPRVDIAGLPTSINMQLNDLAGARWFIGLTATREDGGNIGGDSLRVSSDNTSVVATAALPIDVPSSRPDKMNQTIVLFAIGPGTATVTVWHPLDSVHKVSMVVTVK